MGLRSYTVQNEIYVDASSYIMNETGTRGRVVVHDTSSTGVGSILDDANSVVKMPDVVNGSGEHPAGVLLADVVNKDLTRTHLNQHKREAQVGGKVPLLKLGSIDTNTIYTGSTPTPGLPCYFTVDGEFSTTSTNSTKVGTFRSARDSDGYVRIDINVM